MTEYCEISGSPIKQDVNKLEYEVDCLIKEYAELKCENAELKANKIELLVEIRDMQGQLLLITNENADLKAALLEVTGNYAVQGKKLELAIEALISSRQFCTWLCEDSMKYRGTDAAHAARSKQIEIGKCLEKLQ